MVASGTHACSWHLRQARAGAGVVRARCWSSVVSTRACFVELLHEQITIEIGPWDRAAHLLLLAKASVCFCAAGMVSTCPQPPIRLLTQITLPEQSDPILVTIFIVGCSFEFRNTRSNWRTDENHKRVNRFSVLGVARNQKEYPRAGCRS